MAEAPDADPRGAMPPVVAAACDGACSGNPGPGGWGALLRFADGSVRELGGADGATTNNRMELTAALALLEALQDLPRDPSLSIRTDSRYLIDGLQKWLPGWKRKGWRTASGGTVLNRDLWERLDRSRVAGVSLVHVRGHSGDPDNDRCDAIAVAFSRGQRPMLSPGPGGSNPSRPARARTTAASPLSGEGATARVPAGRAAAAPADSAASGANRGAGGAAGRASVAAGRADSGGGVPAANAESAARGGSGRERVSGEGAPRQGAALEGVAGEGVAGEGVVGEGVAPAAPPLDPAPPALQRLLGRLELADRLAAGGHGLSLAELAQLVEMPLRSLENRSDSWRWRDWLVHPLGDGRWRLERDAQGLQAPE
jgi:ribonuclease HI